MIDVHRSQTPRHNYDARFQTLLACEPRQH